MVELRKCKKCGREKPLFDFPIYDHEKGLRRHECGHCHRGRMNTHYRENLDHYKKRAARNYRAKPSSQWSEQRRESSRQNAKRYSREWREIVIRHYGGKCACCGEDNPGFLTLDHTDNNGCQMRKVHGVGLRLYRWITKNNYPEIFQVLCYNCNCGRALNNGVCPHKTAQGRSNDYLEREYAASEWQRKRPEPKDD